MYRCRICSKEFTEIPPDAVEIAAKRRGALYQFGGEVHDLSRMRLKSADHRWHRNVVFGCELCFPPKPEPPIMANPEPPVEQTQVAQPPLPPQMVEEVKEPDEIPRRKT